MYVIQDKETMRFLSWRSMPDANKKANSYLYITYSGKLGTDFFETQKSAEIVFNMLQKRNEECNFGKLLCIAEINEDELQWGETFMEHIPKIFHILHTNI